MARGQQFHTNQTHYLRKTLAVGSITSASAVNIGYIPSGAVVLGVSAVVSVAFDSATSDVIDIGTSADANGFASAVDISSVGLKAADDLATSDDLVTSVETLLTATWTGVGTAPTVGTVDVVVEYAVDNEYA